MTLPVPDVGTAPVHGGSLVAAPTGTVDRPAHSPRRGSVAPPPASSERVVSHPGGNALAAPSRARQTRRLAPATPVTAESVEVSSPRPRYLRCKRTFDILVALVLVVGLSPLLLLVAILVRSTSPGPVLFRQARCGTYGRPFTCYKFRTMVVGADHLQCEISHLNELAGPIFKIRRDPRTTRVGRLMRKTSLDELPQLWNVLRGDMSIVGPRPPLPNEVDQYDARQRLRLTVQPGLTCIWQVSGRSDVDFDHWVDLDLEYIRRRSFAFDLALVLRTIPALITTRGAY